MDRSRAAVRTASAGEVSLDWFAPGARVGPRPTVAERLRESVHPQVLGLSFWVFFRFLAGVPGASVCACVVCYVGAGAGASRLVLLRWSCRCCCPCLPLFWRWPCGGLARVGFRFGWSSWLSLFQFIEGRSHPFTRALKFGPRLRCESHCGPGRSTPAKLVGPRRCANFFHSGEVCVKSSNCSPAGRGETSTG